MVLREHLAVTLDHVVGQRSELLPLLVRLQRAPRELAQHLLAKLIVFADGQVPEKHSETHRAVHAVQVVSDRVEEWLNEVRHLLCRSLTSPFPFEEVRRDVETFFRHAPGRQEPLSAVRDDLRGGSETDVRALRSAERRLDKAAPLVLLSRAARAWRFSSDGEHGANEPPE